MGSAVEPGDWGALDQWWSAYARSTPITHDPTSIRMLKRARLTNCWDDFGPWWQAYADTASVVDDSAAAGELVGGRVTDAWNELDSWWDTYVETGHETAVQIADVLERSTDEWERSDAPFDTDPLAVDLARRRISRGPLQPSGEVSWSRWLARLLRPSAALVTELFGVAVTQPPSKVVREEQLSKDEGTFRRPDVLVFHADRAISIEVKLNDENYRKTSETASLVERHYNEYEWTHTLLLPKRKEGRLDSIVEPSFVREPDDRRRVEWDDPGPIDVLYWQDVTAAIRAVLRQGGAVDDHWAANAYLFCAVAEQQIMDFQPQPIIEDLAEPSTLVDTIRPIGIADTLGEQLTYLREQVRS